VIIVGIFGLILILGGIVFLVRATDWRDRPKTTLPVKPQATFIAEEVITVSRRRTVKATKGI
jgi:hypothetical protein